MNRKKYSQAPKQSKTSAKPESGVKCWKARAECVSCHISYYNWKMTAVQCGHFCEMNRKHFPRNHDSRPIKHLILSDLFVQWTNNSGTTIVKFTLQLLIKVYDWRGKKYSWSDLVVSIYFFWCIFLCSMSHFFSLLFTKFTTELWIITAK